jgi:hypothetical protein
MLLSEIIAVYSDSQVKHANIIKFDKMHSFLIWKHEVHIVTTMLCMIKMADKIARYLNYS